MNLASILKMLGIKVPPEHIKAAEELIPKLPALVKGSVDAINSTMGKFDERLKALETEAKWQREAMLHLLAKMNEVSLNGGRNDSDGGDTRPAGIGATQRGVERGDNGNI